MWLKKLKDKYGWNWLFFAVVLLFYFILTAINPAWGVSVAKDFFRDFLKILPILVFVYFLIFVFNILIEKKKVENLIKNGNYLSKLIFVVFAGILSSGPVYLRFPLLKKFRNTGLTNGHIVSFVYARSIKLPLFPMMISFLGLKYTLIFYFVLFFFSFIVGVLYDLTPSNSPLKGEK